jgi:Protein of unknown function (DUF3540)
VNEVTMSVAAKRIQPRIEVVEEVCSVSLVEGASFVVSSPSGELRAKRATSCLVAPEPEDRVLVARAGDEAWILTVLERSECAPVRIEVDGDVSLRAPSGRFTVAAQEGIALVTAKEASVVAEGLSVQAGEGRVHLGVLSYLGRLVRSEVERVQVVAGVLDQLLDRFSQRVKRSYRFVEGLDVVRAGQIDQTARGNLRMHGRHAIVTANQLVKMDGEQIHVG